MSADTEFFWTGARERRLLIQRCAECKQLRHPPAPACPACHCLEWDTVESSGRGRLYSYTVAYHPAPPGFTEPAVVVIVELDEGVRLVSNLADADPATVTIGEPLEVFFVDQEEGWTAPQFRRPR
jgi:uncharacterized protein